MPRIKAIAAAVLSSFGDVAHRHLTSFMAREGLVRYMSDIAAAPGGAAAAPAAAAPAAGAAPAAAAPAAAAPAAGGDAGKPPVPGAKPDGNIIGDAKAAPAAVSLDDAKKYLTDQGVKAEDLAKLDEAGIRAKHEELKKAEAGKAAAIDPKSIEIKLPEGITLDEQQLTDFKGILADANLSPSERGQRLVDMHVAAMTAAEQKPYDLWNKTQADWQGEVKADKEIGGPNLDATKATVARVIDSVGGKEAQAIRDAFNFTGAGNHPAIVRFVARLGKYVTEGGPVAGTPVHEGAANADKALTALYPSASKPR